MSYEASTASAALLGEADGSAGVADTQRKTNESLSPKWTCDDEIDDDDDDDDD